MLPGEIVPFAQAHIEELKKMQIEMLGQLPLTPPNPALSEKLVEWERKLATTIRGFQRFEACMVDETAMKDRAEKRVRHCRLNHKDQ